MPCKSCLVLELQFDILLKESKNLSMIPILVNHFQRRDLKINVIDNQVIINESGIRELLDFSEHFMGIEDL